MSGATGAEVFGGAVTNGSNSLTISGTGAVIPPSSAAVQPWRLPAACDVFSAKAPKWPGSGATRA